MDSSFSILLTNFLVGIGIYFSNIYQVITEEEKLSKSDTALALMEHVWLVGKTGPNN